MEFFNMVLVKDTKSGDLIDILDLDQEQYASFLTGMEKLIVAYKVLVAPEDDIAPQYLPY